MKQYNVRNWTRKLKGVIEYLFFFDLETPCGNSQRSIRVKLLFNLSFKFFGKPYVRPWEIMSWKMGERNKLEKFLWDWFLIDFDW